MAALSGLGLHRAVTLLPPRRLTGRSQGIETAVCLALGVATLWWVRRRIA